MTPDWTALSPHRPLDPGADNYVPPPGGVGDEIARWVLAGGATVLVGGSVGVGKSTELAQVAQRLRNERVVRFVSPDLHENMRRITPDRLLFHIAAAMCNAPQPVGQRMTLVLDGLEKVPPGSLAMALFAALGTLPATTDIITVVPWHLAFGPHAVEPLVRAGECFVAVRALEVDGERGEPGRAFLRAILERRLGMVVSPEAVLLVMQAAVLSGGSVRTFLQLMAGAGTYARLRRTGLWPDAEDLAGVVAAHRDSLQRILLPGDRAILADFDGTDGIEMEPGTRVRMLAHGMLLERVQNARVVLQMNPLLCIPVHA